ncbi:amino acid ABC transporter permease [soil metagenome]
MNSSAFSGAGVKRPRPAHPPVSLSSVWHDVRLRSWIYQAIVVVGVLLVGGLLFNNAQLALARQGITTGFGFLANPAGFEIGDRFVAFDSADSFLRAYAVAVLNTLSVAAATIVLSTIIGVTVGVARLAPNRLARRTASFYVEVFRNTPQLVLLIFIYTVMTKLPAPRSALSLADVAFLSNRGLSLPWLGTDFQLSVPALRGFNFSGGTNLSPEFLALLLALSLYVGAFIAEIVRAGIQSVSRGQVEAAKALGLRPAHVFCKVVFPQALRGMVPPAAIQYVSVVKNSSLGVAIGYPELFSVNNTIATLSGQVVEAIAIMMSIYLGISFVVAMLMNLYNRSVQLKGR